MKKSRYRAALKAVELGRACLLGYFGKINQIEVKEKAGLVSEADRECENLMKAFLERQHPDIEFLGEETSHLNRINSFKSASGNLDPLD